MAIALALVSASAMAFAISQHPYCDALALESAGYAPADFRRLDQLPLPAPGTAVIRMVGDCEVAVQTLGGKRYWLFLPESFEDRPAPWRGARLLRENSYPLDDSLIVQKPLKPEDAR